VLLAVEVVVDDDGDPDVVAGLVARCPPLHEAATTATAMVAVARRRGIRSMVGAEAL